MICRRIANRFLFNKTYILWTINNELKSNAKRLVHSSNITEIDYLVSRYRLTNRNSNQINGKKISRLAYFNTIEDFSYKTDKEITTDCLQSLLNINKTDANKLVRNYPILTESSVNKIEKQFKNLSSNHYLRADQFLSCPWILYLPINFIKERIGSISTQDITNDYLVLLLLPFKPFLRLKKRLEKKIIENIFDNFNNRLNYFTENLKINSEEFCDLIHDNVFLFSYEFEKLEKILNLLLSAEIEPETIVGDIKIFKHNIKLMEERIAECKKYEMPIKTWMLRSPQDTFEVALKRHIENKKVLKDHSNNIEYLATQLNCNIEIIRSMSKRYPRIVSINAKKLSNIITFLFSNGFSTYHIVDTPKILFHSVDKIHKRTKELAKLNLTANALKILALSDEEYQKLMEQLRSIPHKNYLKSQISN